MQTTLKNARRFLALDLETTGLDEAEDKILEVGWFVLDGDMNPITKPDHRVVTPDWLTVRALYDADDYVREMHAGSGLTAEVMTGGEGTLTFIVAHILGLMDQHTPDESVTWHLLGNSVHFDRRFIDRYMPLLSDKLHHRIMDVSSLIMFYESASGRRFSDDYEVDKSRQHRAQFDILDSYLQIEKLHDLIAEHLS